MVITTVMRDLLRTYQEDRPEEIGCQETQYASKAGKPTSVAWENIKRFKRSSNEGEKIHVGLSWIVKKKTAGTKEVPEKQANPRKQKRENGKIFFFQSSAGFLKCTTPSNFYISPPQISLEIVPPFQTTKTTAYVLVNWLLINLRSYLFLVKINSLRKQFKNISNLL